VTREVTFLSNDYTNPNTSPKILTTLKLTLIDPHEAFEAFVRGYCNYYRPTELLWRPNSDT